MLRACVSLLGGAARWPRSAPRRPHRPPDSAAAPAPVGQRHRPSASTRPPTSRASRRKPPTTCSRRCRASRSAAPTRASAASARRRENVLINGQRITNKIRRRGRSAAAHARPPMSTGSRSSMRQASASPACPARSPTSSSRQMTQGARASSNGIRRSARISRSRSARRRRSATPARPARSTTLFRSRTLSGRGGLGGPIRDLRRQPCSDRDAERNLPFANIDECVHAGEVRRFDGPGSSLGNLTWATRPTGARHSCATRGVRRPASSAAAINRRPSSTATSSTSTAIMNSRSGRAGSSSSAFVTGEHEPLVTTAHPALRQHRRRRIGNALQPRHAHSGETDRPRRISLEDGRERLAGLVRAGLQLARPEGRPVRPRAGRRLRRDAVSRGHRQGHGGSLRGAWHRSAGRSPPISICRWLPAPKLQRSTGSTDE